ncbi:uncharacterized protein FIBRA_07575 [Fibroporia radiculosa]|uniref:Uncharacterized protein n=1 Tax=Fibroporia radiculosa TaxID=599839 RepID=J4IBW3_9APHY|nr:uncharacterized protein FIBRA_07575 [Fibroporia radiculosa]CCM05361.1 predicted protein [Fibroporia radiculosa]
MFHPYCRPPQWSHSLGPGGRLTQLHGNLPQSPFGPLRNTWAPALHSGQHSSSGQAQPGLFNTPHDPFSPRSSQPRQGSDRPTFDRSIFTSSNARMRDAWMGTPWQDRPSAAGPTRRRNKARISKPLRRHETVVVKLVDDVDPALVEGDDGHWFCDTHVPLDEISFNGRLSLEDKIVVREMSRQRLEKGVRDAMAEQDAAMERNATHQAESAKRWAERDAKLEERERQKEAERLRAEELRRQREVAEIDRLHKERIAREQAKREEEKLREAARREEEKRREAARRRLEEERRAAREAKRQADERERQRQEKARQEAQREAQQRENELRRLQEEARNQQAAFDSRVKEFSKIYEEKWKCLRSNVPLPELVSFNQFPWPFLDDVQDLTDITEERIGLFIFHPLREEMNGKTVKERIRAEFLKWHPDKLERIVLNKVRPGDHKDVLEIGRIIIEHLVEMSGKA